MTFLEFARSHGLIVDALIEGRWARTKTMDKERKRNGSYKFLGDIGFVQNHATMDGVAIWHLDGKTERIDSSEWKARQAIAMANEEARQSEAREVAAGMVSRAVTDVHPYLVAKGFPDELGLVLDGELLIPMRDFRLYKRLNSLQRIAEDGKKLFLPGGKAKGSVFFLGPFMARERWLVEGYATGLSVRLALRELRRDAQIVICFSASNLSHLGQAVKPLGIPAFVFADHDESDAGEKAAIDSGLPWVMAPEVGDANDWHQRYGVRALVKVIRDISVKERQSA